VRDADGEAIVNDKARTLAVNQVIDERPLVRFHVLTILLCRLVIVLDGFDTQAIGVLAPSISESLGIPLKALGPIFSGALFGPIAC
jgi:AAHS family 4-hydroxybenzoate transporter-like MFS transporter